MSNPSLLERVEKAEVLERLLRRRISDLEGTLRYLRTQAANGTLHPQSVIQNADAALRGIAALLKATEEKPQP